MLFFAWSLVSSAVQYARRKRLLAILRSYMLSPFAARSALICRRLSARFTPADYIFGQNKRLSKAPSEPILNKNESSYETILYHTEDVEVLSTPFLDFKIDEWIPAYFNRNHLIISNKDSRVFFVIKTVPLILSNNPPLDIETSGVKAESSSQNERQFYLVDDLANRIACKRQCHEEMMYEASLDNFYMIVIYWCEGNLRAMQGNFQIQELSSIRPTDLDLIRGSVDECASFSSSLAVYSSFASLNADKEVRTFASQKLSKPFSLLELLYEQDRGIRQNSLGVTNINSTSNGQLFTSDTALNEDLSQTTDFRRLYSNYSRRSYRTGKFQPVDSNIRYRSCSPSINHQCFTASSSIKRSQTRNRFIDSPDKQLSRFSSPSSVPIYIRMRRRHCDSEPSSSSSASVIIPSVELQINDMSRSSTLESDYLKGELPKEEIYETDPTTKEGGNGRDEFEFNLISTNSDNNQSSSNLETPTTYLTEKTDSPRDQILPLRSAFQDLFQRPHSYLYNSKTSQNSNKMACAREIYKNNNHRLSHTESHNQLFLEISTEHFNPRRRSSLAPESKLSEHIGVQFQNYRRRSLSPLSLSLLANYGSKEAIDSISSLQIGFQNTDSIFQKNRCTITPKRRTHSMSSNGTESQNGNGVHKAEQNGTCISTIRPKTKPPTILIYTGDRKEQFDNIAHSLHQILPRDTYTLSHLSTKALRSHPWVDENAACLLIADTKRLDDQAWVKLQSYFIYAGKILFVCQNSLVANLTNCDSVKKQVNIIKSAFGKKATSGAFGKDFESFMKKSLKTLNKTKEVQETFHAKDVVGGYKFSVVFHKKPDQPLLLYMENSEHQASALFSDATTDQLLSSTGQQLIAEAMNRLGIQIKYNDPLPRLTRGYMVCQTDNLVFEMDGLSYGDELGEFPKLFFRPTAQLDDESLPNAEATLLPIEVRRRKSGIPNDGFNIARYFDRLQTKSLGRAFLYVPICDTTIKICKSLNRVLPTFDGIVVSADVQRAAIGRAGNQWLSPKGSISFSFDFNVPINSELGKNVVFLQHILAVSIVDAVLKLSGMSDFPLRIKWPNDIYYGRSYKVGGILVSASSDGNFMRCIISAGLNVANSNPTVCINDMLPTDFEKQLTVEETLAEIMNKFEFYVNMFVNRGKKDFLEVYEKFWLHSREEVTIIHEENGLKDKVVIRGLDPNGYLEVRSKNTGKLFSVFDNGNTFDMLKGLIRPKG